MLADEYILSFISLSAHIQPTEFYQLLLLSSSSVFQSAAAPAEHYKFQHSSKLWPLQNKSIAKFYVVENNSALISFPARRLVNSLVGGKSDA